MDGYSLTQRGLHGVELIVSDSHSGMKAARKAIFQNVPWQRCQFHFAQNAQSYIPKKFLKDELSQALRDIFNCQSKDEARQKLQATIAKYQKSAPNGANFSKKRSKSTSLSSACRVKNIFGRMTKILDRAAGALFVALGLRVALRDLGR